MQPRRTACGARRAPWPGAAAGRGTPEGPRKANTSTACVSVSVSSNVNIHSQAHWAHRHTASNMQNVPSPTTLYPRHCTRSSCRAGDGLPLRPPQEQAQSWSRFPRKRQQHGLDGHRRRPPAAAPASAPGLAGSPYKQYQHCLRDIHARHSSCTGAAHWEQVLEPSHGRRQFVRG